MQRNWKLHTLFVGMANAAATLENRSAIPQKVKQRVYIQSRNSAPRHRPKRNKNMLTQTFIHEYSYQLYS